MFLAGSGTAVVAAGVGGAAILAARDGEPAKTSPITPEPTPEPTAVPTPTSPKPGGSQTITSPGRFNIDTFDAQLTGESSVIEILGRTHSRLVQWAGHNLVGDLAQRWETPDDQTVILHLDPAATWQDRPPLNGRAVTADDVVAHFNRSLQIAAGGWAPLAQRYRTYGSIQSVDSPGAGQVRFRMKVPDPFLLDTLASEFALIQAPEAVTAFSGAWSKADSDHVIGSGPWTFDWADDGLKFTAWRSGHRKPLLDELHVVEPSDAAERFADGSLDEAIIRDPRDSAIIPAGAEPSMRYEREIVMSSFHLGSAPWSSFSLVNAISAALLRPSLVKQLFGGRAEPAFPVPPSNLLPNAPRTLIGYPGYLDEPEGAASLARQWWEAAGGPGLGTVTIDFPSVFDPLYSASSLVTGMLNKILGPQFKPAVETYTTISKRVIDGYYGNGRAAFWFGWGPPLPTPSAERYLAETYAPGSAGVRETGATPFALSWDANNVIGAGFHGIVPWVQQFARVYRRSGINGPEPSPFWNQHLDYQRSNT
jgi:ABC-type transport system substrate-binding protein